jgi:hypothetical protein
LNKPSGGFGGGGGAPVYVVDERAVMLPQQIHVGHGVLEFCLRFVEHVGAVFLVGGFVVEPRHNGLHGSAERDAARAGYRGDEIHHVSFQMRRDNAGL